MSWTGSQHRSQSIGLTCSDIPPPLFITQLHSPLALVSNIQIHIQYFSVTHSWAKGMNTVAKSALKRVHASDKVQIDKLLWPWLLLLSSNSGSNNTCELILQMTVTVLQGMKIFFSTLTASCKPKNVNLFLSGLSHIWLTFISLSHTYIGLIIFQYKMF